MKMTSIFPTPILPSLLLGGCIALAGCVSTSDQLKQTYLDNGTRPMSGQEIHDTIVNNTLYIVAHDNSDDAVYHQGDGKVTWMVLQGKHRGSGSGKWHINDNAQYCEEYSGKWAMGERCFSVYPGTGNDQIVMILESGKKSKVYTDGIYRFTVIPGNKYNL